MKNVMVLLAFGLFGYSANAQSVAKESNTETAKKCEPSKSGAACCAHAAQSESTSNSKSSAVPAKEGKSKGAKQGVASGAKKD